jgi:hypothetical protein
MDYRSYILHSLLDKYENSSHFYGSAQVNRRVALTFTRKTLPAYFAGDRPQDKTAIHQAVAELSAANILTVDWLPGEKGNLLKRISLNLDTILKAYTLANRTPKADQLTACHRMLSDTLATITTPWLAAILQNTMAQIEASRTLPSPFPADSHLLELLLKTFRGLDDKGEEELPERIFSIRYLGNSKLFTDKTRSTLTSLARLHLFKDADLSDEDILAELGLVKTSAEILLAGPLTLTIDGKTTNLASLTFGAVIDSHQAARATIASINTDTILLVENKTNFHELIRQKVTNHLLIYLGGFPGPGKRRFLTSLGECAKVSGTRVFHWGDIDFGGFRIYRILKETAFANLTPLLMDEDTLLAYRHMAEPLKAAYKNKLTNMASDARYAEFHSVIQQMLTYNIRLEQEAILADSAFSLPSL